jgi:signal transduction histidine kinase/CheY-like chemotaxis protein/HAMP domain-containing protein
MTLKDKIKTRLKTKLAVYFLLTATVPLMAAMTIIYFQRELVIKQNQFTKLAAIRDLKVREINHWLGRIDADMRTFSQNPTFRNALILDAANITLEQDEATRTALDIVANDGLYNGLFLIDSKSGMVAAGSKDDRLSTDISMRERFKQALEQKDVVIHQIEEGRTGGNPLLWVSVPMIAAQNDGSDTVEGAVVATIDLEHSLYDLLLNRTGLGETGESLLVNKDAVVISALRWHDKAPFQLRIGAAPSMLAAAGQTGVIEAEDYRGVPVLAAYTHIPKMQWGFVAKQDIEEVNRPIAVLLTQLLVLLGLAVTLVFIISLIVSRSISKPVTEMADTARHIAKGDFSVRNSVSSQDELGFLASSFNHLADTMIERIDVQNAESQLIVSVMSKDSEGAFGDSLLKSILSLGFADMGAFYSKRNGDDTLSAVSSIGLNAEALLPFDMSAAEGVIGKVAVTGRIERLDLGENPSSFHHRTVAGDLDPKEMTAIPFMDKGCFVGALLLGSIPGFSRTATEAFRAVQPSLETALLGVRASQEILRMAMALEEKNAELIAQAAELKRQSDELRLQTDELKEQRREVERASRLKTQFLSNMSHELRTPLNSILSIPQALLAGKNTSFQEKDREYLRVIERNGRALLSLINDILDLSKIEAGKAELKITGFDAARLIREVVTSLKPLAEQKGLAIDSRLPPDLKEVVSDRQKLSQILVNLVGNAVKFTKQGTVIVEAASDANQLFISVSDTGIGIGEEDIHIIFDEFRQVDGSTARAYEGTGLGLAITKRLVELLDGGIQVSSRKGEGSTFTVQIPLIAKDAGRKTAVEQWESAPPSEPKDLLQIGTKPDKAVLLVVEDNKDAREQIVVLLEEMGFHVKAASSGFEALEIVESVLPAGIVLDLMMPGMDGFELLDNLRSRPETADAPVLVLTAKELTEADTGKLRRNHVTQLVNKGTLNREALKQKISTAFLGPVQETSSAKTAVQPNVKDEPQRLLHRLHIPKDRAIRILAVEDIPDNLTAIELLLRDFNCTLEVATDGMQCLLSAKETKPDIILLDIQLPKMSGFDILKKLRSDPDLVSIPLVAVTARAMKGDRDKILAQGFDAYVSKPLDKQLLLDTLAYLAGQSDRVPISVGDT